VCPFTLVLLPRYIPKFEFLKEAFVMAKLFRGLVIFVSCVALSSAVPSEPAAIWRSSATLEINWAARIGETLTLQGGRSQTARTGILFIDANGITFRLNTGKALRWPFLEIETFDLTNPRQLVLRSYENQRWHRPGEKDYTFRLAEPVPPTVAAALAQEVGKPSRNGVSGPQTGAVATVPARHPTHFGGSNGTLRFTDRGIDYVTAKSGDSRNWRWSDIRTLANPNPYHLRVDGYRDTYDFLLKEPLSRDLFYKLWDHVYARDLNVSTNGGRL
jgi:hypothetical protein